MGSDLKFSKKMTDQVSTEDAQAALLKASKRVGKAYLDKQGRVILSPRSSMHRVKMTTEIDTGKGDVSVVTYSGRKSVSGLNATMMLFLMVILFITVIGLIIFFICIRSSKKALEKGFNDATSSAFEMLT